jgi:hypothetical protein
MRRFVGQSPHSILVALATAALLAVAGGAARAGELAANSPPTASSPIHARESSDGEMLDSLERVRHLMQQAMAAEVHRAIQDARQRMAVDPQAVSRSLAIAQAKVRTAPELDPAQRDRLLSQIDAAARSVAGSSTVRAKSAQRDESEQQSSIAEHDRQQVNQQRLAEQQTTADRLARANSLASRGQYRDAEAIARQAASNSGGAAVNAAAATEATLRANIADTQSLAERRRQGVVQTFRAEDAQHAENLDGEPIEYPSAEKWQALSERRKQWRENASAYRPSAGEAKINQALKETVSIDFQNEPLADAIDYLKTRAGIEIQFDNQALNDAAIGPSSPVTRSAHGIRLRSALRLLLDDLGLTWIVRDDVLMITSKERADEAVTTRAYDVADLVIPIPLPHGHGMRGLHRYRLPGRMPF